MPLATPHFTLPRLSEVLSAAACAVLAVGGAVALPLIAAAEPAEGIAVASPGYPVWWVVVALVLGQSIALLWSARAPRIVLTAIALVTLVHALAIPGSTFSLTTLAVIFAVFWAVVRERLRRLTVVLPLAGLLVAGSQVINEVRGGAAFDIATIVAAVLQAVTVVGIPIVVGLFFAARQDARAAKGKELLALQRERDALIQAAVSRERMAMSRELHDIAAHHMSGIALLASAIYKQVDADPAAAKFAAQQVRAQSTTVLDDLRRVIGLLRDEGESSRSVQTLAAVRELVEARRSTGVDVKFVVHSTDRELGSGIGPLAQLVVYRMVQESLANAAVHAPGANCTVEIDDRDADSLTVRVSNDGSHAPDPGPGSGFGLVGMRERADLVAGKLHYAATPEGGWDVSLTVKRESADESMEGLA